MIFGAKEEIIPKYYDDDNPKSVQKTAFGLIQIISLWLCYYCNAFFDFWQVFLLAIYKEMQGGAFLRRLVLYFLFQNTLACRRALIQHEKAYFGGQR